MNIVVALGGNALGNNPIEQLELVRHTATNVADLIQGGHQVTIVHGNGPQVGMINNAFDAAHNHVGSTPLMPLPECGAMSQGYIGYHLQNAIKNALLERRIDKEVVTVVTQTIVAEDDSAFAHPSKPIGSFYDKATAERLSKERNLPVVEDSGRGYRFVVASPKPIGFVEERSLRTLIDSGTVVIAAGGGGIPVVKRDDGYHGVPAVIDKDRSSAALAQVINADIFVILTAVDRVMLHFGTPEQRALDKITITEAKRFIAEGHFAKGSMLPKVEAAIEFVSNQPNNQAIIASLEQAASAIKGKTGTIVYAE